MIVSCWAEESENADPEEVFAPPPNASLLPDPDLTPSGWSLGGIELPRLLQKVNGTATLVTDGASDGVDQFEIGTSASVILPDVVFASTSFFSIGPSFSMMTLEGPTGGELPGELYRTGVTIAWMNRPTERTTYSLGFSPSIASDFDSDDQPFRPTAHAMATYQWRPDLQFMFGVVYVDRNDISVLPMAGMIWTPREDLRVELTMPRPRIARRILLRQDGDEISETWLFLAGEFGGGTWSVQRRPEFDDELTIQDFRFVVGFESKHVSGRSVRVETGFVFGRKFEYESDGFEYQPPDALMLRGALSF